MTLNIQPQNPDEAWTQAFWYQSGFQALIMLLSYPILRIPVLKDYLSMTVRNFLRFP